MMSSPNNETAVEAATTIAITTTTKRKTFNPLDEYAPIELDWRLDPREETDDADRFSHAVNLLYRTAEFKGHRSNVRRHVEAVLIICARMEKYAPNDYVAYARDNNADANCTVLNPLGLKLRKIRQIVDRLEAIGWLETWVGFRDGVVKRRSRFKAMAPLKELIVEHRLTECSYYRQLIQDGIILRDVNKKIILRKSSIFDSHTVERYNWLMRRTDVALAECPSGRRYMFDSNQTYRVFTNGQMNLHGRWYGNWWVNCSKQDRRYIVINGSPTVELDYKANHLWMIYGLAGQSMPEGLRADPYAIPGYPRAITKSVFTKVINASSERSAWRAMRDDVRKDRNKQSWLEHIGTLEGFREVVAQLLVSHPLIESRLYSNYGLTLMYHDSEIAECVIDTLTEARIPCLCIHDSFLVPEDNEAQLRTAMTDAYECLKIPRGLPTIERMPSLIERDVRETL
jgi:hypothetical protein